MASELPVLIAVARLGGFRTFVAVPSRMVGQVLGRSQQSASRYLIDLERRGLVEREMRGRTQFVRLSSAGRGHLRSVYRELDTIISGRPARVVITGTVASGMGEGAYYLSQEVYRNGLASLVGFTPYPGTLNVIPHDASQMDLFHGKAGTVLPGYTGEGRTFGAVRVMKAILAELPCAIVVPERAHRTDVLEIIADRRLRDALCLADGDEVTVYLE